jgi:hypothetical protein
MNKRVFISFAVEDRWARDYLVGQAKNDNSPFDFIDMSVKEPWSSEWKTKCRARIKGCDGVIALLSSKTINADGARWEMRCAIEEDIPIRGMYVTTSGCQIPSELSGKRVMNWAWANLKSFIDSL